MCFKKLFPWLYPDPVPDPIPVPDPPSEGFKKIALLFAINNYPGTANDLDGCLNDQRDVANKLNELWPGEFTIKKFADSQVTSKCYKTEVAKAIAQLHAGATVIVMADSCFSGTITRYLSTNPHLVKNRFIQIQKPRRGVNKRFAKGNISPMKWLTFAGCKEDQTSADAYINKEYHGAFTFYALKTLLKGLTYKEWEIATQKFLPNKALEFDQAPYLEGSNSLSNKLVFEGEVLLIHNSSHGTQVYDENGDESDGYDEAIYLYDTYVTDDEINELLQKILV